MCMPAARSLRQAMACRWAASRNGTEAVGRRWEAGSVPRAITSIPSSSTEAMSTPQVRLRPPVAEAQIELPNGMAAVGPRSEADWMELCTLSRLWAVISTRAVYFRWPEVWARSILRDGMGAVGPRWGAGSMESLLRSRRSSPTSMPEAISILREVPPQGISQNGMARVGRRWGAERTGSSVRSQSTDPTSMPEEYSPGRAERVLLISPDGMAATGRDWGAGSTRESQRWRSAAVMPMSAVNLRWREQIHPVILRNGVLFLNRFPLRPLRLRMEMYNTD